MTKRTTNTAEGGTLTTTETWADGKRTEAVSEDHGDGFVTVTTRRPDGTVATVRREVDRAVTRRG